ncbi:MAG TPA: GNAT family N-acetyltransferase [Clostridia bacterium]|nr:GNAT family N-acetyltransferase [Clostridia bacterium]
MDPAVLSVREEDPAYLDRAVGYFSEKWGIDRRVYEDSISFSLDTSSPLPRWYLLMERDTIIGSYSLIANDFISRQDLWPWLCALYVEESERGKDYGGLLLAHGRREAKKLGFGKVYLSTDHTSYYERYGWKFIGMGYGPFCESHIYESGSIE